MAALYFDDTKFVSFGPIGAGKTTTLRHITKSNANLSHIESTEIVDKNNRLNFYLEQTVVHKKKEFFFPLQMEVLHMRFRKLINSTVQLIDETIFSAKAYSLVHLEMNDLTRSEFDTFDYCYQSILDLIPRQQLTVLYFHCSTKSLMQNIAKRYALDGKREIEKLYEYEYVDRLNRCFQTVAIEIESQGFSVKTFDTENIDLALLAKEINETIFKK